MGNRFIEFFENDHQHLSMLRLVQFIMIIVLAFGIIWAVCHDHNWITTSFVVTIVGILWGGKVIQKHIEKDNNKYITKEN